MPKSSSTKTYLFTEGTTVELEPGVYGLMPDTEVRPLLLAWGLDPALGGPHKLLDSAAGLDSRPAICAVPGYEALYAGALDRRTNILHVETRPHRDPLVASGAALALASTLDEEVDLSDILPMLDPLDETLPAKKPRRDYSYEDG